MAKSVAIRKEIKEMNNLMVKRVSISLDEEQLKLLNSVKGFGTKEAEKVKSILMTYLAQEGYVRDFNKKK